MSGPRSPRPAVVRFYIDADALGLAHVLVEVRPDVTYPGDPGGLTRQHTQRPACSIDDTATKDADWIPVVAAHSWTIITRDKAIERRPAEVRAVLDHGAKLIVISSSELLTVWHQLEIVMSRWRDIERISELPGPYIQAITRTSVRRIR